MSPIEEIDLAQALRDLPDNLKDLQPSKTMVQCQSCKAVSAFSAERVGQRCEFCGSPGARAVRGHRRRRSARRACCPFKVSEAQRPRGRCGAGTPASGSRRAALKQRALVDTIKGIYIPYWTFDAKVRCPWQAEAGHYYYVTEEYRDNNGKHADPPGAEDAVGVGAGRPRPLLRRPAGARHARHPRRAAEVDRALADQDLISYDTAYLSGFVVERYQVALDEAAQQSREAMDATLRDLCAAQVPGDTYRNLRIDPDYSGETFKHILVPVWVLAYTYGAKAFQVLANGYTGKIDGEYPKSIWKILFVALARHRRRAVRPDAEREVTPPAGWRAAP